VRFCEADPVLVVSTVNVNGLRAAVRKGMLGWLEQRRPDVLCLQEVRAPHGAVKEALSAGSWSVAQANSPTPGRAGVAIAARTDLTDVIQSMEAVEVSTGRWIEATIELSGGEPLAVVSAYAPRGDANDDASMAEKHAFLEGALERLTVLRRSTSLVLLAGDLNVAHTETDLDNWRAYRRTALFHPEVRRHLDRMFDEFGWVDLCRHLAGEGPVPFTCWSYRGPSMFERNAGGRLDYQIATPDLAGLVRSSTVDRSPTAALRWSDHAPVSVAFDLDLPAINPREPTTVESCTTPILP